MPPRNVDSLTVEIEFTAGVWTDVTAWHRQSQPTTITQGTDQAAEDAQPGTLNFTLENYDGRFTPDNPLSPHFPNVVEGVRVRVTAGAGGVTATRRITARIKTWKQAPSALARRGWVQVAAADRLGNLARTTLRSDIVERWLYRSSSLGNWCDVWTFADSGGVPGSLENIGASNGVGNVPQRARVIPAAAGRGTSSFIEPEGLLVDGAIQLLPNDTGPVILMPVQTGAAAAQVQIFFRTTLPTKPAQGDYVTLFSGRNASDASNEIFTFRVYGDAGNGSGYILQLWVNGVYVYLVDKFCHDGAWHSIFLYTSGGVTGVFYDDPPNGPAFSFDLASITHFIAGGQMNPRARGAQSRCIAADFAAPMIAGGGTLFNSMVKYSNPTTILAASLRAQQLMQFTGNASQYAVANGGLDRNVIAKLSIGRTPLEVSNELARTSAGTLWVRPSDDFIEFRSESDYRPTAVGAWLALELDDDNDSGGLEWERGTALNPTRQSANSPAGSATYVDTAREAFPGEVREGSSLETVAATERDVTSLAAWSTMVGQANRIRSISVDPTTAVGASTDDTAQATATTGSTSTYLVTTNADAADMPVGTLCRHYDSAGRLRDRTVRTITAVPSAFGFTNLTVSPPFSTVPVSGDVLRGARSLWADLLTNLKPGMRLRVDNLDPQVQGVTYEDGYVTGWAEEWYSDRALFSFNLQPADSPGVGVLDDSFRGKLDFDADCQINPGISASATSITFTTAGWPLTTDPAQFPVWLQLGQELVRVDNPPASSSSPQTVTIVRGQGSSVPYAHPVGERVRVAPQALAV